VSNQEQLDRIERKLNMLTSLVRMNLAGEVLIMADLTELETQVQATAAGEASAVVLIQRIASQLEQNATDPAKIREFAASLKTSADALAAAVVAVPATNTPPAPARR
jgi:hypothetical protein